MTSRQHLEAELDQIRKKSGWISFVVWAVAVLVMVFGIPIVYELLTAHDVPGEIAWLLSIASDGALIVGLVATPVLAQFNVPAGWIGTLRWIAGFITWGLQTLGPFTEKGGPDVIGVITHSAGPVLLFFVVEGASYFQRRMGEVITRKRRELDTMEKADRDDRTSRAALTADLNKARADLNAAVATVENLNARLEQTTAGGEAERVTATLTVERLEAEIGSLRTALTAESERLTAEHNEAVRELKEKHREKLNAARAEASTVSLNAYRRRHNADASTPTPVESAVSDVDAVQAMVTAHSDPDFEWSKNAVRTLTGVGFKRAERLIELWAAEVTGKGNVSSAVNQ